MNGVHLLTRRATRQCPGRVHGVWRTRTTAKRETSEALLSSHHTVLALIGPKENLPLARQKLFHCMLVVRGKGRDGQLLLRRLALVSFA